MCRLIWGFVDPTHHIVGKLMSRLNYILSRHRRQSRTFAYMINSWYACLPLIWFGKTSEIFWIQTICKLWKQVEERERETIACKSRKISCIGAENDTWRCLSCASAFARQSRIFDSIDALHAFYHMPKCLNWWNILSWIPFGSDLDLNSDNVFFPSFPNITKSGPSSARRRNSFKLCLADVPMMAQRCMLAW